MSDMHLPFVIPAQAGIQGVSALTVRAWLWIPACAGMTEVGHG
jgi:hypothetical protein